MKQLISVILTASGLLAGSRALAQSHFDISGRIQYDQLSYFDQVSGKINSRNEGLFRLGIQSVKGAAIRWKAVTELREDLSDNQRNRMWIDELWVKQTFGQFDLTIGKQLITWGTTDGINPVNNINPIDYSDLLDTEDERIGVYGLRGQFFLANFDLDLFWSPIPVTGKMPGTNSRWFPSAAMMGLPEYLVQSGIQTSVIDQLPEPRLSDGEVSIRFRAPLSGCDLALSYFNGYDHLPDYQIDVAGLAASPQQLILNAIYRRQQVAGAELAVSLPAGIGFRGESAVFVPDQDTPSCDRYLQTVVGLDKSFSLGNRSLMLIAQYIYDYNLEGNEYAKYDVRHLFKNSLMGRLGLDLNNGMNFRITGICNLGSREYYLQPELEYSTPGSWQFLIRADLLEGPAESFFGSYSNNDRLQCKVVYRF